MNALIFLLKILKKKKKTGVIWICSKICSKNLPRDLKNFISSQNCLSFRLKMKKITIRGFLRKITIFENNSWFFHVFFQNVVKPSSVHFSQMFWILFWEDLNSFPTMKYFLNYFEMCGNGELRLGPSQALILQHLSFRCKKLWLKFRVKGSAHCSWAISLLRTSYDNHGVGINWH